MVPYDVLVDPLSMPVHPVLEGRQTSHDIIHAESIEAGKTGRDEDTEEDEGTEEEEERSDEEQEADMQDDKVASYE